MKNRTDGQAGFSTGLTVVAIVVVFAIAGVGTMVFKKSNDTKTATTPAIVLLRKTKLTSQPNLILLNKTKQQLGRQSRVLVEHLL